jgi:phage baseplate assembly protein W
LWNFGTQLNCALVARLSEILSPVWTLSLNGGGAIAEGIDAIRQCIDVIVRTTKGTDPLRPLFGCDVYLFQDAPLSIAIPNMKKALLDAIGAWEPRVSITSIDHTLGQPGNVIFNINYTLADKSLSDSIAFLIGSGGIVNTTNKRRLILQGFFPPNPAGYQYQIYLVLNNSDALPAPPVNGFASTYELFTWLQKNWGNYGQWYMNASGIVGYISPNYSQGTISIGLLVANKYKTLVPGVPIGSAYTVSVTLDGTTYSAAGLQTADQVLQWAKADQTLGALGIWQLEIADDSFSADFNDDFDVYQLYLSVYTQQPHSITITITTN